MGKGRRIWIRVSLCLASALALLLLGELWVRASSAWFYPRPRELHSTLGWALAPSVRRTFPNEHGDACEFVTNRWGQVGGPVPLNRRRGKRRLLFLGDSFTEGLAVGADEIFSQRLQDDHPDLEAINTGVACYGTVQQLLYLRDEGLRFAPDHVLLMFFENDLSDNTMPWFLGMGARPHAEIEDGKVRLVEAVSHDDYMPFCLPMPLQRFWYRHSYLYQSLNQKGWQRARAGELAALDERTHSALTDAERRHIFLDLVERMRDLLVSRQIDFSVVLIPRREHVQDPEATPYAELLEGCASLGIRTLPLLTPLRAAQRAGGKPYFEVDMHWTREGHAVAARAIEELLRL